MQETGFSKEIEEFITTVRRLSTKEGYFARFYEILAEKQTHREAYEQLEAERGRIGLPCLYSCIESFHKGLYLFLNSKSKP